MYTLLVKLIGVFRDRCTQLLALVTVLELEGAGLLKVAFVGCVDHLIKRVAFKTTTDQQLSEGVRVMMAVGASVILSGADTLHDDPHAVPGGPVDLFAFLAIIVPVCAIKMTD
jgi:hypothetical protein